MTLADRKKLALAATPGPWRIQHIPAVLNDLDNLRFIAACSPDYILKLIACVEAATVMHGKVSKSWGHSYPDCDCVLCSFEVTRAALEE